MKERNVFVSVRIGRLKSYSWDSFISRRRVFLSGRGTPMFLLGQSEWDSRLPLRLVFLLLAITTSAVARRISWKDGNISGPTETRVTCVKSKRRSAGEHVHITFTSKNSLHSTIERSTISLSFGCNAVR